MKILEPVEQAGIPRAKGGVGAASEHEALFERVLSLDGKALPIEFENAEVATRYSHTWRVKTSACAARGIRVRKRGNTLYLSKGSP